jgi:hypothetical protein
MRYKLIQWYPGIPERFKDEELIVKKLLDCFSLGGHSYYQAIEDGFGPIKISDVEDNPKYWKKIEKIVTTRDGVDIYEGDQFYYINCFTNTVELYPNGLFPIKKNLVYFYFYEKAREYHNYTKPIFSKKDVEDIINESTTTQPTIFAALNNAAGLRKGLKDWTEDELETIFKCSPEELKQKFYEKTNN